MFGRREKKAVEDFISGVYDRTKVLERNLSHVEDQVYELRKLGELSNARLGEMSADNKALALQLRCMEDYGGHDWVFVAQRGLVAYSGDTHNPYAISTWLFGQPEYEFKCSRCGHTRSFPWGELNKKEQDALTAIGLGGA